MSTTEAKRSSKSGSNAKFSSRATPGPESWEDWVDHLGRRKRPRRLGELLGDKRINALTWPLVPEFPESDSAELVCYLDQLKPRAGSASGSLARRLEAWLEGSPKRELDPLFAIECLAWAHALPRLAPHLPAAPWCQLLEDLAAVGHRAANLDLVAAPLAHQLLKGELPLTLAYQLPELESASNGHEQAATALSAGIIELLDGEGLLNCKHRTLARPLLACWTRCVRLSREAKFDAFNGDGWDQYEWFIRESLRFSRSDSSQMLVSSPLGEASPELFRAALGLIDRSIEWQLADNLLSITRSGNGKQPSGIKKKRAKSPKLPPPAVQSEWAETAMLRRDWGDEAESLAIMYGERQVELELNCGRETVWSGCWDVEIQADGRRIEAVDDFSEVCWVADEDVDYLELEVKLAGGWRLQRQVLLARDRFLLLADALLGERMQAIEYKATLPLCDGIKFKPAEETCEGLLKGRRNLARVLPLDLQEWRTQSMGDELLQTAGGLTLSRRRQASRLFACLFVDLDHSRLKRETTWRQLTVAQRLERQSDDVAVGFRIQIGKENWLVYRSLAPKSNRTVLGQNYNTDFVVAQFPSSGEAVKLLEIE